MIGRRGLAALGGLILAAVWLLTGSSWPVDTPVGATRPQPAAPPLPALQPVPAVDIGRLTTTARPLPSATRDPFRFVEARQHRRDAAADPLDTAAPASAVDLAPRRPEMQLIGLAEDEVDGSAVRTAIITSLSQIYLVHEGDQIALRFLVDRIGADAVQLRDLTDDATITLALR